MGFDYSAFNRSMMATPQPSTQEERDATFRTLSRAWKVALPDLKGLFGSAWGYLLRHAASTIDDILNRRRSQRARRQSAERAIEYLDQVAKLAHVSGYEATPEGQQLRQHLGDVRDAIQSVIQDGLLYD